MSQRNVEILRAGYEAVNRATTTPFCRLSTRRSSGRLRIALGLAGSYHGHDGVKELLNTYLEAFDGLHVEPEEFFDGDDRIVVFIRETARGRGRGVEVEIRIVHLVTMRGGKAVRLEYFPEREKALEAAGLSE